MSSKDKVTHPITGEVTPSSRGLSPFDPLALKGSPRVDPVRPLPPLNTKIFFNQEFGSFVLSWDSPDTNPLNSKFDIAGVNIYRSIDSSEGPYTKLNTLPIPLNFYQDVSQYIDVVDEVVAVENINIQQEYGFIKLNNYPIIDKEKNTYLYDPDKILINIDGVNVRAKGVRPLTGELELYIRKEVWDPINERFFDIKLPSSNSTVLVSYCYTTMLLQGHFNFDQRIFYKVTSVSQDGKESLLQETYEHSYQDFDHLNYIQNNIISKNSFLLNHGGERSWLYIQRSAGQLCRKHDPILNNVYLGAEGQRNCTDCFGTGYKGGYIGPFEVHLAPFDTERSYKHSNSGRIVSSQQETFLMNYPVVRQGDLIVRQNGERYIIGPVKRKEMGGVLLQQNFSVNILQPTDILYKLKLGKVHEPDYKEEVRSDLREPDKKHLDGEGKTPRFRNIHYIKEK